MTTLIFVLVWVVLGFGLLLIAFSGGPSGALQQLMSQTRGARRAAIVLFSLLALALGVLIPAAVIAAVSNQDDIPEANVTGLTASEKNGRELFALRCANCHTLKAANAIAFIGPNLDQLRPTKALVLNAIENGRANGNGQMAAGLYTGQDAEDVANFVAKAVGQTEQPAGGEGEGGGGGESGGAQGESGGGEGEGGGGGESGGGESESGGAEDQSGGAEGESGGAEGESGGASSSG